MWAWLAAVGDAPVLYARWRLDGAANESRVAVVDRLAVMPKHRNRGYSNRTLEFLFQVRRGGQAASQSGGVRSGGCCLAAGGSQQRHVTVYVAHLSLCWCVAYRISPRR